MPNHRMNSGTQAIEGIERSACRVGSTSRCDQRRIAGDGAEEGAGDDAAGEARGDAGQRRERVASAVRRCSTARRRSRRSPTAAAPAGRSTSRACDREFPEHRQRRPAAAGRAPGAHEPRQARACGASLCGGGGFRTHCHENKRHNHALQIATPRNAGVPGAARRSAATAASAIPGRRLRGAPGQTLGVSSSPPRSGRRSDRRPPS